MKEYKQMIVDLEDCDHVKNMITPSKKYKVKVCDRFNTIEWETENPTTEECQKIYDVLAAMDIKEEKPQVIKKTTTTTVSRAPKKKASEAQLKRLRQKSVPYDDDITAQQAYLLLQKYGDVIPNKNIP